MARSAYVYLVMKETLSDDGERSWPVAPFTVKHELVTWLRHQTAEELEKLFVVRGHDNPGPDDEFVDVAIKDLLS